VTISSPATLALAGGPPVRPSFLPFHQPLVDADDERAVLETLRSGWLTTGPRTKAFEKDLAAYTHAAHCVAVNSCTAALHLALDAVGVGAGDEVITSPITFASTANVIVHQGARPVFVDVEPDTFNIDPAAIERALTSRTRALIPVDFAGQPCDLDAIMAIGARHGIPVRPSRRRYALPPSAMPPMPCWPCRRVKITVSGRPNGVCGWAIRASKARPGAPIRRHWPMPCCCW
jgi:hypothetical protein